MQNLYLTSFQDLLNFNFRPDLCSIEEQVNLTFCRIPRKLRYHLLISKSKKPINFPEKWQHLKLENKSHCRSGEVAAQGQWNEMKWGPKSLALPKTWQRMCVRIRVRVSRSGCECMSVWVKRRRFGNGQRVAEGV